MGITQHRHGVEGVQAIVNVGLARGNVGRDGAGLMPIRGHCGVQGGAEMGAYATAFPGGDPIDAEHAAHLERASGASPSAPRPGSPRPRWSRPPSAATSTCSSSTAPTCSRCCPIPPRVEARAGATCALRVHQDIVLTHQMFVDGRRRDPAARGHPLRAGGRRHRDHDRAADRVQPAGRRRRSARRAASGGSSPTSPSRVQPDLADRFDWQDNRALRAEIGDARADCTPASRTLSDKRDQVQYGGRHLCAGGTFPTPSGKGHFTVVDVTPRDLADGEFFCSTRRGKQFNSMIFAETDPLTGAARDAVYIDADDARLLGVAEGDRVRLTSQVGRASSARPSSSSWPAGSRAGALAGGQRAARRRRRPTASRRATSPTTTPSSRWNACHEHDDRPEHPRPARGFRSPR